MPVRVKTKKVPTLLALNSSLLTKRHGRPQTFFQGGGKNILLAQKMPENILFSFKKVKKHTIFIQKSQKTYYFGRPGGRGQVPPLALPADAHAKRDCVKES